MDEEDCRWAFIEDQHAETKYELAVLMEEAIFEEVVKEISAL